MGLLSRKIVYSSIKMMGTRPHAQHLLRIEQPSKDAYLKLLLYGLIWGTVTLLLMGCAELESRHERDRLKTQSLLGVTLSEPVAELRYFKYQPNPSFEQNTLYIRLLISEEVYTDLTQQLKLESQKGVKNKFWYLLPGEWHADSVPELEAWWQPTISADDTATGEYGNGGWIIAKYEQGYAYIKRFDPRP